MNFEQTIKGSLEKREEPKRKLKEVKKYARSLALSGIMTMTGISGSLGVSKVSAQEKNESIPEVYKKDKSAVETKRSTTDDYRNFAHQLLKKQYKQAEDLQKEEVKVKSLFGDFCRIYSEDYIQILKKYEDTIILKLSGGVKKEWIAIPYTLEDINKYSLSGSPETNETAKTHVDALNTEDGMLSKETLERILQETYPKGWVNNEVYFINQRDYDMPVRYKGVDGNALAAFSSKNYIKAIDFYKSSETQTGKYIVSSIGHEIGHANSWENDSEMTVVERIDLVQKVYERTISPDRFYSSYVESIKEDDPSKNNYYKVTEYWAEICAQYFTDPTKLNVKDFALVDIQVKKTDPKFDVMAAKTKRESLTPGVAIKKEEITTNTK